jgi:hypothetical protein
LRTENITVRTSQRSMKLEIKIDCPDPEVAALLAKLLPIISTVGGDIRLPKAERANGKAVVPAADVVRVGQPAKPANAGADSDSFAPRLLGTYKYKVLSAAAVDTSRYYTIDDLMAATGLTREQVRSAATDASKTRGEMVRDEANDTPSFRIIDKGIENLMLHRLAEAQNAGKASAA